MSTTLFDFTPTSVAVYTFQPTLDGETFNASVPFSLFGNRPYLNLVAVDGTPVWYGAVVGSPDGARISTLSWASGKVSAATSAPHGLRVATVVELTLAGSFPDAYNGRLPCLITGPLTFSYALADDPGSATVFGAASFDINMIGGVQKPDGTFFSSSLVYRESSRQFEVSP